MCLVIHAVGFSDKDEPFSHWMFYCGTFYGYVVLSILMCVCKIYWKLLLNSSFNRVLGFSHVHWSFGSSSHRRDLRWSRCYWICGMFADFHAGSWAWSSPHVFDGSRRGPSHVLLYESGTEYHFALYHNVVYDAYLFGGGHALHYRTVCLLQKIGITNLHIYLLNRNSIDTDAANQPLRVNCPCSKLTPALDDIEVCTYFSLDPLKSRTVDRYVWTYSFEFL